MSRVQLSSVVLLIAAIFQTVRCGELDEKSQEEVIALTRDHLGRTNPDALLNGFIPVWAIVIYIIAGTSLVFSILAGACWLFGCRNPHRKTGYQSAVSS